MKCAHNTGTVVHHQKCVLSGVKYSEMFTSSVNEHQPARLIKPATSHIDIVQPANELIQ